MDNMATRVECARGEIMNALQRIQEKHTIPSCILDGILSSVLAEIRAETKLDIINEINAILWEKEKEIEKAKAAAKKVLRTEPEEIPEQEEQTEE